MRRPLWFAVALFDLIGGLGMTFGMLVFASRCAIGMISACLAFKIAMLAAHR